jgi:hypothetical protein
VNLHNVEHDFAVATLKATKQNVTLTVGKPMYTELDGDVPLPPPPANTGSDCLRSIRAVDKLTINHQINH